MPAPRAAAGRRYHAMDGLRAVMMLLGLVLHSAISYGVIPYGEAWPYKDASTHALLDAPPCPDVHAPEARTPLLIAHGKADPRVNPGQSLEMYRALKTVGKAPVRLVLYPGEGHGNRKSAARYDYCLRLIRWMEHYLMGPGGEPPAYQLDYR